MNNWAVAAPARKPCASLQKDLVPDDEGDAKAPAALFVYTVPLFMANSVHDGLLPTLDRLRYWKLHVPFLYDMCVVHRMNSPVVAAAWLPGESPDTQRFMVATRRFERRRDQHNCVFTGSLCAPLEEEGGWDNDGEYAEGTEDAADEVGHSAPGNSQGGIDITNRVLLPEDVFRVKVSPSNSCLLAVQMSGGSLWMINSEAQGEVKPLIDLHGLDREGFGLDFHSQRHNMLLSASFSGRTCVWDVSGSSSALWSAKNIQAQVEDCCWCPSISSSQVLATVASDNHLRLYDTRCSGDPVSVLKQSSPFLCCACSPLSNLLVTGRQDSIISVFDPRRMGGGDVLCGSLTFHRSAVYTIAFHPHRSNLFATGDADGQVAVWDLNRSHLMQPHSELKNGHVCLGFVHGGHKERCDLSYFCFKSMRSRHVPPLLPSCALSFFQSHRHGLESQSTSRLVTVVCR